MKSSLAGAGWKIQFGRPGAGGFSTILPYCHTAKLPNSVYTGDTEFLAQFQFGSLAEIPPPSPCQTGMVKLKKLLGKTGEFFSLPGKKE